MAYVSGREWAKAPAERLEPTVTLRDEDRPDGSHLGLWAYLDASGRLHIDGQDLGPVTRFVSGDGEYEYFKLIAKEDVPRLVELMGGKPGDDVLELLRRDWSGGKSYDLEAILSDGPIEVELGVWTG